MKEVKKNVFIFIVFSGLASILNYLTYPMLAHILPANQYINVVVSLSLLTQMSTFLASIVAIAIGLSKSEEQVNSDTKIELLQSMLFKFFIALGVVFLAISPLILPKIHIPLPFVLPIFFMMIVSIPIAIISGYLNGKAKLVKMGFLIALSATLQIVLTVTVGFITRNGLWATLGMGMGQLITIPAIYLIFSHDKLPKVGKTLLRPIRIGDNGYATKLFVYTLAASLAVMFINLVQIADLLIIQAQHGSEVKFYTDIYVISRAVYFGGMIFIWPFLAEISLQNHQLNRKPLIKVCAYFCLIALAAIIGIDVFGGFITHLLFGVRFNAATVREIGVLSILYKLFFLIITAVALYFIVLRSYIAIWLSLAATAIVLTYVLLINDHSSLRTILFGLDSIAGVAVAVSLALFFIKKHELDKE
jgi:O-antigen/teichoic acid export membrane protein